LTVQQNLNVFALLYGVKNRAELAECVAAAAAGPLPADLVARIDRSIAA
jgi:aryl-alcohol dehydrogenase-like predicted oxidoreductase